MGDVMLSLVKPGMKPKDLMKAAEKAFPTASKSDIVRAAFYAIISNADSEPVKVRVLQNFALSERTKSATDR
ncbi:hypothetical protein [Mesorhizobium sp. CN2-181]|uniref:hypothetical protein n=1 Tax=Mesorhizobium yinganensis TaxID=3157707 RepID=UPI0032B75761